MRLHRFYVSQPLGEEVVTTDVSLLNQWTKVFRYTLNDTVILFNGDGSDYHYSFSDITKKSCSLTPLQKEKAYIPKRKSFLFLSLIKKDNFELVVQKAVECGVTDIVPIIAERTEKKNLDFRRLHTISIEASEQSGRGDILTIHETVSLQEAFTFLKEKAIPEKGTYITTLEGTPIASLFESTRESSSSPVAFFVGPEGGWSTEEEAFFKETPYCKISFGETVLRAETAGITCGLLSMLL